MKGSSIALYFSLLTLIGTGPQAAVDNWPAWRGPEGNGVTVCTNLPVHWSTTENVRWRANLPEWGNSSPIVWDNRVFVTQPLEGEHRRLLLCFDREAGKQLWQAGVTYTAWEPTQPNNSYCTATPATDGQRIIAWFSSAGLYCYDFSGNELWHRDLGKINHMHGSASSPVLSGELCVVFVGPGSNSKLVAVNKRTGQTVWEVAAPNPGLDEQSFGGGFERGGGPFGRGGRGGRGGFGPSGMLSGQFLKQGDKDGDGKLSQDEFLALGDTWFDKLDPENAGKVDRERFLSRWSEVMPAPEGLSPPGGGRRSGPPGRGGGFGPNQFIAGGLFAAADANHDNIVTRPEFKAAFTKWFAAWDSDKSGALDEGKLRSGLMASIVPDDGAGQRFGSGPGGPGEFRGPNGRGFGQRGGMRGGRGGMMGGGDGPNGTWSSPTIVEADGHRELVMSFSRRLAAYNPQTGEQLWICKGLGDTIYSTPVYGDGVLVATSGGMGGGSALALKPGAKGEVTEDQRLWLADRIKSQMGSGVIDQGHFYGVAENGIAECFDLKTGKIVWEERLHGPSSRSSSWSSLLLAGDKIYIPNQAGDVFVLRASAKFEVLATNSVQEGTNASLAASQDQLFLRTEKSLWCFGK